MIKKPIAAIDEDFFLQSIKKKGFLHGRKTEQLREKRPLL